MHRKAHPITRGVAALLCLMLAPAGGAFRAAEGTPEPSASAGQSDQDAKAAEAGEGVVPTAGGASVPTGLYRGVVTDRKSGHPVGGAHVVFLSEETGETIEATTDPNGVYETRLPAGDYVVDIKVGKKTYRSAGTFREEASGKRWVMDFTIGSKLSEKDLKIETTPSDIRVVPTEPRPPMEPNRKKLEMILFIVGALGIAAMAE